MNYLLLPLKISPKHQVMKKSLLTVFTVCLATMAMAQCNQLFISEYVVGTGNDKAYELYNPTNAPINLNGYVLQRWSNGEAASTDETILMGTIPAYGTWVVANGQTEDIDLGTFISPGVSPELQALADQLDNPYPAPTFMNGNDALVLVLNGSIICDIFGKPAEDPGTAWSAPDGTFITNSQTMVRKPEITGGVTSIPTTFLPMAQYDTLGTDNWTNLGMHACQCDPTVSVYDQEAIDVNIYPNPISSDMPVTIEANYAINRIEIYDMTGKLVDNKLVKKGVSAISLDMSSLSNGVFILNIYMENNTTFSTKLVKE